MIFLDGEFAVYGQIHRFVLAGREEHGEFHHGVVEGIDPHVGAVLVGGKHLFQQRRKLHFAPGAAQFYVREYFLDIRNAARQLLHFPDALVHRFQTLVDERIGFVQAVFKRCGKFFVHCLAYLFQIFGVLLAHVFDLAREHARNIVQALFGQAVQFVHFCLHARQLRALVLCRIFGKALHILRVVFGEVPDLIQFLFESVRVVRSAPARRKKFYFIVNDDRHDQRERAHRDGDRRKYFRHDYISPDSSSRFASCKR